MPIRRLGAPELAAALQGPTPPVVVDVREPWEVETAAFPGALSLPLGQLVEACTKLDPKAELVLVCHHGVRSHHAAMYLASQGFENVADLAGGIEAWSRDVDPTVPRY